MDTVASSSRRRPCPRLESREEIHHIASRTNKSRLEALNDGIDNGDDNDDDALLSSSFLHALSVDSVLHLSRILSTLSAHVPLVEKSLKSRVHPMNWESVLNIMAASGQVESRVVQRAKERLEAIYGLSQSEAVLRTEAVQTAKRKLSGLYSANPTNFMSFKGPIAPPPPKRRVRKRKTKSPSHEAGRPVENVVPPA